GLSLVGDPFAGVSHNFSATNGGTLWINPTAFCAAGVGSCPTGPIVAGNPVGNATRNKFHGPGYGAVDFSILKNIPVRESLKVQLRAEMFNIFNRVNLASAPGSVPSSPCAPDATGRCAAFTAKIYGCVGLVADY